MVKPFSRPSINLGGPKREWKYIEAQYVEVGDLVGDRGKVGNVETYLGYMDPANLYETIISTPKGVFVFKATDVLYVFAEVSNG
jgi:hypothetical protein